MPNLPNTPLRISPSKDGTFNSGHTSALNRWADNVSTANTQTQTTMQDLQARIVALEAQVANLS